MLKRAILCKKTASKRALFAQNKIEVCKKEPCDLYKFIFSTQDS